VIKKKLTLRLVFGASQYYLFINPAKASSTDPQYTFEDAQNEIGKATGVISSSKNMTQGLKLFIYFFQK